MAQMNGTFRISLLTAALPEIVYWMAGSTYGRFYTGKMVRFPALLTVAIKAVWNKTVCCVAIGASNFRMFTWEILQLLRGTAVTHYTLIGGNCRDV